MDRSQSDVHLERDQAKASATGTCQISLRETTAGIETNSDSASTFCSASSPRFRLREDSGCGIAPRLNLLWSSLLSAFHDLQLLPVRRELSVSSDDSAQHAPAYTREYNSFGWRANSGWISSHAAQRASQWLVHRYNYKKTRLKA